LAISLALIDTSTILSTVISTIIIAILTYLVITFKSTSKKMNNILINQQKYDRILFGEDGIDEWTGILNMLFNLRDSTRENKYILRTLTNKLVTQKKLDSTDKEIECILKMLNTPDD